jgi:YesN/AraC family two-component response regulator
MVGYKDAKQFTKAFRKITGISPVEYRNKYAL